MSSKVISYWQHKVKTSSVILQKSMYIKSRNNLYDFIKPHGAFTMYNTDTCQISTDDCYHASSNLLYHIYILYHSLRISSAFYTLTCNLCLHIRIKKDIKVEFKCYTNTYMYNYHKFSTIWTVMSIHCYDILRLVLFSEDTYFPLALYTCHPRLFYYKTNSTFSFWRT